jgi:hypothetical protein
MATKKSTSSRSTSRASRRAAPPARMTEPHISRNTKPFVRLETWITMIVLVALVGFAFFLKNQKAKQEAEPPTPTPGATMLFSPEEGLPNDIKIVGSSGQSVEIAHNQSGMWVLKTPTEAAADQASAEAAATQVNALSVLGNIDLGLEIVGLDKPSYTITITFTSSKTHTLTLGSVTPTQTGYYAQLDGGKVQIVDKQGLDALLSLLTNPPYIATETPIASSTPEATLTPSEATPTIPVTGTATKSP